MKKIITILLLLPIFAKAQSYELLVDSALQTMWKGKDSLSSVVYYPAAYALYKQAFDCYPDKVEKLGLYKAGYLAARLGHKQEAFRFLNSAVDQEQWSMILGRYASDEFSTIIHDPQWPPLESKARMVRDRFIKKLMDKQRKLEAQSISSKLGLKNVSAEEAYRMIKTYNQFPQLPRDFMSLSFKINDSLQSPYLVCLPKQYDPHKSYPLLFSLHGGVLNTTGFPEYMDSTDTGGWNRFYTKYAQQNDVIMVYPNANKYYNWMSPDQGFFMVPGILKAIKQIVNVDDNRVFITGHSNGATGSFSYLMKQPAPFAAFYGFNTRPRVATGGTYIRNILNRSFFNVSTDEDYYFPPDANDSLTVLMKKIGADYQDHRYNGFPHWFPAFNDSEAAHQLLFADLLKRARNPFRPELYWECDDVNYGRCDWLSITQLDTAAKPAEWQTQLNFDIKKWKYFDAQDSLLTKDTLMKAFKYDKSAGAAHATYRNNIFKIKTSGLKRLSIYISPEMVNMKKKVSIEVNGKRLFKGVVMFDKARLLEEFYNSADRKAVWVNRIDLEL
jgi:dienelactone hydrolase